MFKPFLVILAVLVALPSILWGFPGAWVLLALVPAFILGTTIAHVRAPREEGSHIRPGVLVLGGMFGLATGTAAVLFMWAAAASPEIVVKRSQTIAASPATIWKLVVEPGHRGDWETWISDIEPVGRGGPIAVGSRYRSNLHMERMEQLGSHRVTDLEPEARLAWTVEPHGGEWRVANVVEKITLTPEGDQTRVDYEIRYEVPSVFGRVLERIIVRQSFDNVVETSLQRLAGAALEQ